MSYFNNSCVQGNINIVKKLSKELDIDIQNGFGATALIFSIASKKYNIVEFLLSKGADIDIKDINGSTALIRACSSRNFDVVNDLLNYGANVNIQNNKGDTAIIKAISGEGFLNMFNLDEELIFVLFEGGADFFIKNNHGESAIDIMKKYNELPETLNSLLEKLILTKEIDDDYIISYSL